MIGASLLSIVAMFIQFYIHSDFGLMLGRALQGFAAGLVIVAASRIIEECSPPLYIGAIFPFYSAISLALGSLGIYIGSRLIPKYSEDDFDLDKYPHWRYVFIIPSALTLISVVGIFFILNTETPKFLAVNDKE